MMAVAQVYGRGGGVGCALPAALGFASGAFWNWHPPQAELAPDVRPKLAEPFRCLPHEEAEHRVANRSDARA